MLRLIEIGPEVLNKLSIFFTVSQFYPFGKRKILGKFWYINAIFTWFIVHHIVF